MWKTYNITFMRVFAPVVRNLVLIKGESFTYDLSLEPIAHTTMSKLTILTSEIETVADITNPKRFEIKSSKSGAFKVVLDLTLDSPTQATQFSLPT